MTNMFTYPQPWVSSGGNMGIVTSFPMGSVCWSASGNPPYQEVSCGITFDPTTAHIYFLQTTWYVAGNHTPSDVRALVAVNTGNLTAIWPPNSGTTPVYGGTSNSVEGLQDTLYLTVGQWRDPINQQHMIDYAQDVFKSVSDSVLDGSIVYHGLDQQVLTPGLAVAIAGHGYTTGWEALNIPILAVDITWNSGVQTMYTTVLNCSNRRAQLSSSAFMRPDRSIQGQSVSASFAAVSSLAAARMGTYMSGRMNQFAQAFGGESISAMNEAAGRFGYDFDQPSFIDPVMTGGDGGRNRMSNKAYNSLIAQLSGDQGMTDKGYNRLISQLTRTGDVITDQQRAADTAQEERRARAAAHGPLREQRAVPPTERTMTEGMGIDVGDVAQSLIRGAQATPQKRRRFKAATRESLRESRGLNAPGPEQTFEEYAAAGQD
jgi:hypothetical protein